MRRILFARRARGRSTRRTRGGRPSFNPGFWAAGRGELWAPYLTLVEAGRPPKAAAQMLLELPPAAGELLYAPATPTSRRR
jgi:hypothetical protein